MRRSISTFAIALTLACTSGPAAEDEAGTTTSPSGTDDTDDPPNDEGTTTASEVESALATTNSSGGGDDDDDMVFVDTPDVSNSSGEPCDSFAQDCPEGEKCVPYAASGSTWNALKCVPIMGDKASGEDCTYADPFESTDDCDGSTFCLAMGSGAVCLPFCTGSVDTPECPPMAACTFNADVFFDVVINFCIPTCDPLVQDCGEGDGCYWHGSDFVCLGTSADVPIGEPCNGFFNECAKGNACTDLVLGCASSMCCTNLCDMNLGDEQCAALPGTTCKPFHAQGLALPDFEHVGACSS